MSRRSVTAAIVAASTLVLASCTDDGQDEDTGMSREEQLATDLVADGSVVISDPDGTGAEVSQRFFESSDTVVVSSPEKDDQLQAAAVAIDVGAPMLTKHEESSAAVDAEVERLGAERVIEVGTGSEQDEEDLAAIEDTAALTAEDGHEVAAVAAAGEQGGGGGTPIFVTELTSRAAAATAAASKLPLTVLPYADPRVTSESIAQVDGHDAVALGRQFGDTEHFRNVIALADNGELPGGGGLVFPGRRMIALYGHPSGPALGQMGEQPPAESVDVVNQYVEEYKAFSDEQVIPAFEVIATVASEHPGEDGNFTNEFDPAELEPYIDAIVDAGGYAVIDLQPGLTTFKEQALLYEDLLKRPNVGLALDAEWKLQPGQTPAAQVGSADAAEINEVTEWLADLTRDNNLPQKALIVHQFQVAMLPDRENIDTSRPELSFVLHADGHGSPEQKFDTWNVLREDLDPGFFLAWKNFIDEDEPMFTPEQTYNQVDPRPWFVSYQ